MSHRSFWACGVEKELEQKSDNRLHIHDDDFDADSVIYNDDDVHDQGEDDNDDDEEGGGQGEEEEENMIM